MKAHMEAQSYYYWLKNCARLPIPESRDFYGAGDALIVIGKVLITLALRILILLMFPISIPFLAYVFLQENKKVVKKNKEYEKVVNDSLYSLHKRLFVKR